MLKKREEALDRTVLENSPKKRVWTRRKTEYVMSVSVWSFIRFRTLTVPQDCKTKYILKQNFGDTNCTVGCADTAGRGAEVDSECTEHLLKQGGDQQTCFITFTTNPNVRVSDCCFSLHNVFVQIEAV